MKIENSTFFENRFLVEFFEIFFSKKIETFFQIDLKKCFRELKKKDIHIDQKFYALSISAIFRAVGALRSLFAQNLLVLRSTSYFVLTWIIFSPPSASVLAKKFRRFAAILAKFSQNVAKKNTGSKLKGKFEENMQQTAL